VFCVHWVAVGGFAVLGLWDWCLQLFLLWAQ